MGAMVVDDEQICVLPAPGHMTPTVLMGGLQQRQVKRGYEEVSMRNAVASTAAATRGYLETVGESEGAVGSPVCVDSEDSSAPKRKCISLNSDGFDVKREIFVPAKMSSSERRYLRKRFRSELDLVRDLLKKPEFLVPVAVNGAAALWSSVAPRGKKGHRGSHVVRGAMGRFLPTKPRLEAPALLSDAAAFKQCEAILKKLMSQKSSHLFNAPVDVVAMNIPDYFDIIKHPMDLGTIKKKLASGSYASPWDFAADVRLTFTNAVTYNPPGHSVHLLAINLSKMFESRWKTIEKKLPAAGEACINNNEAHIDNVEVDRTGSKRRKTPPVDHKDAMMECIKPKMTSEEKEELGSLLQSLSANPGLPDQIIDLLQQSDNVEQNGVEMEIDIHAINDDVLFELKKQLDKYVQEKNQGQAKSEPSENEVVNVSGLSHLSTHLCKGGENVEEDVDICGNTSPILIEKDAQIKSSKCSSPSSSSSDSGSSSSDSDSDSDSENESDEKAVSPTKLPKGNEKTEQPLDQEKSDILSPLDANRPGNNMELQEQDSRSKPAPEGENAIPGRQVSPDKLLRAALLRSRYADVIVKARGILNQGANGDKQEELEKLQKEEKARLLAEANAAMEARRAEAEAEAKRKRDLEREKARQALQEMERTVEINDNLHPKDLEMLGTATAEHIVSSVDETSPERSQDGMPCFVPRSGNPLEQLGLFMKADDDDDEEEEPSSVPSIKETEEGEVN